MSHPTQVLFTGSLISFAQGFAQELIKQGYRPHAATHQLRLVAHLSRWLDARRMDAEDITPAVLNKFLAVRRAQGYTLWLSPQALMPFLDYLRSHGLMMSSPKVGGPSDELLTRYGRYLLHQRGLAESSTREYVKLVRPFVANRRLPFPRTTSSPARQSTSSRRSLRTSPARMPRRTSSISIAKSRRPA